MGRPYPSLLNGRLLGIGSLAHLASAIKERFRLNGQDFRDYVTRYLGSRFYRKQFFDLDLSCNVAHDLGVQAVNRAFYDPQCADNDLTLADYITLYLTIYPYVGIRSYRTYYFRSRRQHVVSHAAIDLLFLRHIYPCFSLFDQTVTIQSAK